MFPYVTLGLSIACLLFFFAYFVISRSNYYERFKIKYDIRNIYPFELNYKGKFSDNLVGNLFLCLFSITSIANYAMFDKSHSGLMILILVMGIFSTIMIILANFVPLKLLKGHIVTAVFTFIAAFATPASIAIGSFNIYNSTKNILALVTVIISICLTVFAFIVLMNPNLTRWTQAEKQVQPDGSVKYVRPKYFVLAFSEWLMIFNIVACQICLCLLAFSLNYLV